MEISDLLFEIAHITPDELAEAIRKLEQLKLNPEIFLFKSKLRAASTPILDAKSAASAASVVSSSSSDNTRERRLSNEDIAREMLDYIVINGLPQRISIIFSAILEIDVRIRKSFMEHQNAEPNSTQVMLKPGQVKIGQEEIRKAWIAQLPQQQQMITPQLCARMSVLADVLRDNALIIFNFILIDKTILAVANIENYLQEHYQNLNNIGIKAQILRQSLQGILERPTKELELLQDTKKTKVRKLESAKIDKDSTAITNLEKEIQDLDEQLMKKRNEIKELNKPINQEIRDLEKPFNDEREALLKLVKEKRQAAQNAVNLETNNDSNNKAKKTDETLAPLPESPKSSPDSKSRVLTRKLSLTSIFRSKVEKSSPRSDSSPSSRTGSPITSVSSSSSSSSLSSQSVPPLRLGESSSSPVEGTSPSRNSFTNQITFRLKLSSPKAHTSTPKNGDESPPSIKRP